MRGGGRARRGESASMLRTACAFAIAVHVSGQETCPDESCCSLEILSVDHATENVGLYFNFDLVACIGEDGAVSRVNQYRDGALIWTGNVVAWHTANGGTVGSSHGRRNAGAAPGQWEEGDLICVPECQEINTDCVASWSRCSADCSKVYVIERPASRQGAECEYSSNQNAQCAAGEGDCPLPSPRCESIDKHNTEGYVGEGEIVPIRGETTIAFPTAGAPADDFLDCRWILNCVDERMDPRLVFNSLTTEAGFDFVSAYSGRIPKESHLLAKLSGSLSSQSERAVAFDGDGLLRFTTDYSEHSGSRLEATATCAFSGWLPRHCRLLHAVEYDDTTWDYTTDEWKDCGTSWPDDQPMRENPSTEAPKCDSSSATAIHERLVQVRDEAQKALDDTWYFDSAEKEALRHAEDALAAFLQRRELPPVDAPDTDCSAHPDKCLKDVSDIACPIGCWRSSATHCSQCPEVYDICGEYGGCHPLGDFAAAIRRVYLAQKAANEAWFDGVERERLADALDYLAAQDPNGATVSTAIEEEVVCTCADGFRGRHCNVKTTVGTEWELSFGDVVWGLMCVVAGFVITGACGYGFHRAINAVGDGEVDSHGKFGYLLQGHEASDSFVGFVKAFELFSVSGQHLQISAPAFNLSIPWSLQCGWCLNAWLRILTTFLSWEVVRIARLIWGEVADLASLFFVQLLVVLGFLLVGFTLVATKGDERGCMSATGVQLIAIMTTPVVRTCGAVFVGCTYYTGGRANTFDSDPSISCWSSWLWWLYAALAFVGMCGLPVAAASAAKHMHTTDGYGYVFALIKVITAIADVAVGQWHPKLMAGINGMLSLTGLVFVVAEKPYKRSLIGSMVCACGHFLAVASFGGAYYAVLIDNPYDDTSGIAFTTVVMFSVSVAIIVTCLRRYLCDDDYADE